MHNASKPNQASNFVFKTMINPKIIWDYDISIVRYLWDKNLVFRKLFFSLSSFWGKKIGRIMMQIRSQFRTSMFQRMIAPTLANVRRTSAQMPNATEEAIDEEGTCA
jgi:hypothetical protein